MGQLVKARVPIAARTNIHNGRSGWAPVAGEMKRKIL